MPTDTTLTYRRIHLLRYLPRQSACVNMAGVFTRNCRVLMQALCLRMCSPFFRFSLPILTIVVIRTHGHHLAAAPQGLPVAFNAQPQASPASTLASLASTQQPISTVFQGPVHSNQNVQAARQDSYVRVRTRAAAASGNPSAQPVPHALPVAPTASQGTRRAHHAYPATSSVPQAAPSTAPQLNTTAEVASGPTSAKMN